MKTILCINGSDSMGHAGIQADIRTIRDLGGHAVTAITSVTVQNSMGIADVYELPPDLVAGQVRAIYEETRPDAVKVGMMGNPETIGKVRDEIVGCRQVVCSPVILSSYGGLLMSNDAIRTYCQRLLPICTLLIVKCMDAEIILGQRICTDRDMVAAASVLHAMGATHVLLRGGTYSAGRINALLYSSDSDCSFFSSVNIEGWQRHGVGGTLSTAIATRMALGDTVLEAVTNAHSYMHCQVVYASAHQTSLQASALYDRLMSLIADNYRTAHDVTFYARRLNITARYLSQVTNAVCGRPPKQIIDDYIVRESEKLLQTTTLSVQQIAFEMGFSSQMAFAKFFKAKKGAAPTFCRANFPS
ncbi:MAG: bifunctional hydroxymethylpyrimidine kinase/phosphomethylpyrimidine kinase [Bacteroidales bacterium]|nr:bifunctional hydroxymethylpyrimidine kinase/phosphomethylpyrimidine kinase [Candidatus Liminaster caballi]